MTTAPSGKLARQALDFAGSVAELAGRASQPGFAEDAWQALSAGVATDSFLYVGRAKEALRWPEFLAQLDRRLGATDLTICVDRVEQSGNLVFLQLEERSTHEDAVRQLMTMTIFEFDAESRLARIDSFQ